MKLPPLAIAAVLLGGACSSRPSPTAATPKEATRDTMAGMAGMSPPAAAGGDSAPMTINRDAAARAGITFARAAIRPIGENVLLAGTLVYPEPSRHVITVRVNGWVQQLFANYTGMPVRAGDPLFTLYSPDVVGAEEEYLTARRLGDSALVVAARRRLELLDVPRSESAALDSSGVVPRTMMARAPSNGEVAEKMVTAGQRVQAGDSLLVLADRSTVWLDVVVHEMDASRIRVGSRATVTVRALPGRQWTGRVTFILPTVDSTTRTLTARIEVANRDGQLRPGMYATVDATPAGRRALSVPLTAVLPTGTRNLIFVNRGDGQFVPRDVQVGARGDSLVEIISGLRPGDEVVASATYLIDSESNLAAAMQGLMMQMGMGANANRPRSPGKDRAP